MLVLLKRFLYDPVVAMGVLGAGALLALKMATAGLSGLTAQDVFEVMAPFGVGMSATGMQKARGGSANEAPAVGDPV